MAILGRKGLELLFFFGGMAMASPPVNLSIVGEKDEEDLKKIQSTRRLKQGDITYTEDHNQFNFKIPKEAGRVLYEVKGRSLPFRDGEVLFKLYEGDFVKKMKLSKDKKWMMVRTLETTSRRCWVPISALKFFTPKAEKGTP